MIVLRRTILLLYPQANLYSTGDVVREQFRLSIMFGLRTWVDCTTLNSLGLCVLVLSTYITSRRSVLLSRVF